jgi:hypothetical protein
MAAKNERARDLAEVSILWYTKSSKMKNGSKNETWQQKID